MDIRGVVKMNIYEKIANIIPIIYPRFNIVRNNKSEELILLNTKGEYNINEDAADEDKELASSCCDIWHDNTQCEAVQNHFHLFDKVGMKNANVVIGIGTAIAKNLLNELVKQFPTRKFVVYLEVNPVDSVIIRFHQVWDNEPPYFDLSQKYNDDTKLCEFKNF